MPGLQATLKLKPAQIIKELEDSGLRGRGGAGLPLQPSGSSAVRPGKSRNTSCAMPTRGTRAHSWTAYCWRATHMPVSRVCASAPFTVGADEGFIYIRDEYPLAIERLKIAIKQAEDKGLLGRDILGSGFNFTIEIVRGAGAFVSGEETAMIAAIEGRRSWPEHRPPYPSRSGLWGRPTLVQNVKTLSFVPLILQRGGAWFAGNRHPQQHGHCFVRPGREAGKHGFGRGAHGHCTAHADLRYRRRGAQGQRIQGGADRRAFGRLPAGKPAGYAN